MGEEVAGRGDMGGAQGGPCVIGRWRSRDTRREDWRHRFWPAPSVDRFIISYPKAGRTWLRVMLAVSEAEARSAKREIVVDEWLRDDAPALDGSRVLFTHALATSSKDSSGAVELFLRYIGEHRRVFLVRDPRDVVVSHFFQLTRRAGRARDIATAGELARDPARGIDRVLRFMSECDRSLREDPGPALLLSYEDLHRDPGGGLESVLRFFGAPVPKDGLRAAVDFGRFDNLQGLEQTGALGGSRGRLGARDAADPGSSKIRRGEIGSFRDYLTADDVAFVESRIAELLPAALGYAEPGVPPARRGQGADALASPTT